MENRLEGRSLLGRKDVLSGEFSDRNGIRKARQGGARAIFLRCSIPTHVRAVGIPLGDHGASSSSG